MLAKSHTKMSKTYCTSPKAQLTRDVFGHVSTESARLRCLVIGSTHHTYQRDGRLLASRHQAGTSRLSLRSSYDGSKRCTEERSQTDDTSTRYDFYKIPQDQPSLHQNRDLRLWDLLTIQLFSSSHHNSTKPWISLSQTVFQPIAKRSWPKMLRKKLLENKRQSPPPISGGKMPPATAIVWPNQRNIQPGHREHQSLSVALGMICWRRKIARSSVLLSVLPVEFYSPPRNRNMRYL